MVNNEMVCPLCEKTNQCGVNQSTACWCTETTIPQELLKQVPQEYVNKTCICSNCIAKYHSPQTPK